jgi:hypothetical protein
MLDQRGTRTGKGANGPVEYLCLVLPPGCADAAAVGCSLALSVPDCRRLSLARPGTTPSLPQRARPAAPCRVTRNRLVLNRAAAEVDAGRGSKTRRARQNNVRQSTHLAVKHLFLRTHPTADGGRRPVIDLRDAPHPDRQTRRMVSLVREPPPVCRTSAGCAFAVCDIGRPHRRAQHHLSAFAPTAAGNAHAHRKVGRTKELLLLSLRGLASFAGLADLLLASPLATSNRRERLNWTGKGRRCWSRRGSCG